MYIDIGKALGQRVRSGEINQFVDKISKRFTVFDCNKHRPLLLIPVLLCFITLTPRPLSHCLVISTPTCLIVPPLAGSSSFPLFVPCSCIEREVSWVDQFVMSLLALSGSIFNGHKHFLLEPVCNI
jgi:hypothetical protein